jgi:hypothetical protein
MAIVTQAGLTSRNSFSIGATGVEERRLLGAQGDREDQRDQDDEGDIKEDRQGEDPLHVHAPDPLQNFNAQASTFSV